MALVGTDGNVDCAYGHGNGSSDRKNLRFAYMAMKAPVEVLHMRSQKFRDFTEHGLEAVRQTAILL